MKISKLGANQTEVRFDNGTRVLISYETPVAAYVIGRGYVRTEKNFSATTNKHISMFGAGDAPKIPHDEMIRIANNETAPRVRFVITGRRWFQKSAGNTYHSVSIEDSEGNQIAYLPMQYGYAERYLQTALTWLHSQGLAPDWSGSAPSLFCRENGISYSVSDVSRQRDL